MDWKEYEKKCDAIREENRIYLEVFSEDIKALSPKTVKMHLNNVDFYINQYLLREGLFRMDEGIEYIDSFLGDFFIRKCLWSTPATIRSTAASIKKFYKCMLAHGFIQRDRYEQLCFVIREEMDAWMEECAAYNDLT